LFDSWFVCVVVCVSRFVY